MKTNDFSYFIERYNSGEMSEAENLWFRKELEGNGKLQQEVNLRKQTDMILRNQDIVSLRNKLSGIEKRRTSGMPVKSPGKRAYIKYVVAVGILVLIGSLAIIPDRKLSTSEIISRYYTAYEPSTGQRSMQSAIHDDFSQALEYYKLHDFRNAALFFSKVVENEPRDMYAILLNGISYFEDNQYINAKQSFGKVIADNKNLYIDQAQWYLALCYLNTNDKVKAAQLLNTIKNEGGIYSKAAKKIIRKL